MLKALFATALAMQVTAAVASEAATYVCVDERTVGWEPRTDQPDAVGQFSPDESSFIVKFRPPTMSGQLITGLADIEVTEQGKTFTYTSNECPLVADLARDRAFGASYDVDHYLELCAQRLQSDLRDVGFGLGGVRYYFTEDPGERRTPIRFVESVTVGVDWAYITRGTCTLAD